MSKIHKFYLTNFKDTKLWLMKNCKDKLAVDTETTSLDYADIHLLGVSLCNGKEACYIDLYSEDSSQTHEKRRMWREVLVVLANIEKLIFHNAPFDLAVLWKYGLHALTNKIFCTKTAFHLIDEESPSGLKYLAKTKLGKKDVVSYKDVEKLSRNSEKFYSYAADDAINTWELHEIFAKELQYQKLDKLFYEIEMPFQFVLRDLLINGVLADTEAIEPLYKEISEKIFDLKLQMVKMINLPYSIEYDVKRNEKQVISSNFDSPKQLIDIITNKLGIEITETTDKGAPSVDKKSLLKLQGEHEFIRILQKYNKASSFMQKSIEPFEGWISSDGRIRTDFKNTGTVTGRLSSAAPNLHNQPREGEI